MSVVKSKTKTKTKNKTEALYTYNRVDGSKLLLGWSQSDDKNNDIGFHTDASSNKGASPEPVQLGHEGHVLTIAPTGAGKGVSCIVPTLLTYPGPVIVIDPKGENAAVTARHRRAMGQKVHIVDPMGVTGMRSSRFNPLDIVDPKYADATDHAALLAEMIVPVFEKDPYWSNRATQMIVGLIMFLAHDLPRASRNIPTLRAMLAEVAADPSKGKRMFGDATHEEAQTLATSLTRMAQNTLYSILSVACDAVDKFRGESMRYNMYASSFDLKSVTDGDPMTIYLVLPPHMLKSHGTVLRLWVGALFTAITRRTRRPDIATLLMIDEAAQLGVFEPLLSSITLMRGYGLRTWTFWQDASQLQRLYPDWPTIVNNCAAVQMFGKMGGLAANDAARLLGLPSSAIFRGLEDEDMVLALAGQEPRIVRRPNYLHDEELRKLANKNPFYGRASCKATRRLADISQKVHKDRRGTKQSEMLARKKMRPSGSEMADEWRRRIAQVKKGSEES